MKLNHIISVLAAMLLACPSLADTILLAPKGTTLTTGQVRAEAAISPNSSDGRYYWLGTGLRMVEVNFLRTESGGGDVDNQVGAQWSFLPETLFTPAVSFGVRDATSNSDEGIAVYGAVTRGIPLPSGSFFPSDLSVTVGLGFGGIRGIFFGAETHLPFNLFAQAEFDSRDFNAAIGWQPTKLFRLKAYTIQGDFLVGAELVPLSF